jgi:hypothetical protein
LLIGLTSTVLTSLLSLFLASNFVFFFVVEHSDLVEAVLVEGQQSALAEIFLSAEQHSALAEIFLSVEQPDFKDSAFAVFFISVEHSDFAEVFCLSQAKEFATVMVNIKPKATARTFNTLMSQNSFNK